MILVAHRRRPYTHVGRRLAGCGWCASGLFRIPRRDGHSDGCNADDEYADFDLGLLAECEIAY